MQSGYARCKHAKSLRDNNVRFKTRGGIINPVNEIRKVVLLFVRRHQTAVGRIDSTLF